MPPLGRRHKGSLTAAVHRLQSSPLLDEKRSNGLVSELSSDMRRSRTKICRHVNISSFLEEQLDGPFVSHLGGQHKGCLTIAIHGLYISPLLNKKRKNGLVPELSSDMERSRTNMCCHVDIGF